MRRTHVIVGSGVADVTAAATLRAGRTPAAAAAISQYHSSMRLRLSSA